MKIIVTIFAAASLAASALAQGDSSISSAQKTLKEQGFYYGEVTGQKDADTSAAIRRYQIRNGLQINGELNAETRKSLGLRGGAAVAPAPAAPRATPMPAPSRAPNAAPRSSAPPIPTEERDDFSQPQAPTLSDDEAFQRSQPRGAYAPGPRGLSPDTSGLFEGTPFEIAPPDVQHRVITGAQAMLARQGFYRSTIDGVYGPEMALGLRAFQGRSGLEPTSRLDMETLGALGLLPGQQTRGFGQRRRIWRRPVLNAPGGERIYIPR